MGNWARGFVVSQIDEKKKNSSFSFSFVYPSVDVYVSACACLWPEEGTRAPPGLDLLYKLVLKPSVFLG